MTVERELKEQRELCQWAREHVRSFITSSVTNTSSHTVTFSLYMYLFRCSHHQFVLPSPGYPNTSPLTFYPLSIFLFTCTKLLRRLLIVVRVDRQHDDSIFFFRSNYFTPNHSSSGSLHSILRLEKNENFHLFCNDKFSKEFFARRNSDKMFFFFLFEK